MYYELEYTVVACETARELILAVKDRIQQGWVPEGGMVVAADSFVQDEYLTWKANNTFYQTMSHQ